MSKLNDLRAMIEQMASKFRRMARAWDARADRIEAALAAAAEGLADAVMAVVERLTRRFRPH
jgi:hypothetical protein